MKKGQIATFIIIGMLIFAAFAMWTIFKDNISFTGLVQREGVEGFVDSCLEDSIKGALMDLGDEPVVPSLDGIQAAERGHSPRTRCLHRRFPLL